MVEQLQSTYPAKVGAPRWGDHQAPKTLPSFRGVLRMARTRHYLHDRTWM
jgi:hypothetical protein